MGYFFSLTENSKGFFIWSNQSKKTSFTVFRKISLKRDFKFGTIFN